MANESVSDPTGSRNLDSENFSQKIPNLHGFTEDKYFRYLEACWLPFLAWQVAEARRVLAGLEISR